MTVDQYGIEFRRRRNMEDKHEDDLLGNYLGCNQCHQVFLASCLEHPLFWVPNKVDSEREANVVALQHKGEMYYVVYKPISLVWTRIWQEIGQMEEAGREGTTDHDLLEIWKHRIPR
ncbi:unnamed protein product [Caenorhabditis brenneri]